MKNSFSKCAGKPYAVTAPYHLISQGLLQAFRLLGVEARMGRERGESDQTDICFLHYAWGAVVHRGKKLVGSAQTWLASSLLQDGSILIKPQVEAWLALVTGAGESPAALRAKLSARLTSLEDILGQAPSLDELKEALCQGMAQVLGVDFQAGELSAAELTLARDLAGQSGWAPSA